MARRRCRRPSGRVPSELRLAYGARARPLGHAILSLLPSPAPEPAACPSCRGAGPGCLACRRWAHLLRDGDPVAYRRLVTRAVCAAAPGAPPPPRHTPGNAGFSQSKLVRETIKWIVADRSCTTKDVLCNGYREDGRTGCISDLVSSSSWDILLHRIGDLLMCYILRHSSIFLPVKKNDYFQVSGAPLNVVLQNPIFKSTMARNHQSQSTKVNCPVCYLWHSTKMVKAISRDNCGNSSNFGVCSSENCTRKSDAPQSLEGRGAVKISEPKCSNEVCNCPRFPLANRSRQCSNCYTRNSRKRKRLYSWQRHSKRKQISSDDSLPTGWSKLKTNDVNVSNLLSDDSAMADDKMNDRSNSLESTIANASFAMNSDDNSSQVNGAYKAAVLSEKSPSCMLDIKPSQDLSGGCNTLGVQYAIPQVALSSYLYLKEKNIHIRLLAYVRAKKRRKTKDVPETMTHPNLGLTIVTDAPGSNRGGREFKDSKLDKRQLSASKFLVLMRFVAESPAYLS